MPKQWTKEEIQQVVAEVNDMRKRPLEAVKRQVREYEVTLTEILPRSLRDGDDTLSEEIAALLFNREWLEEQLEKHGKEGAAAVLWQRVQELDGVLISQHQMILEAYPRYLSERRRLRIPQKYWWWYLDEIETAKSQELAVALGG
jgi:hypothetical protein